MLLLMAYKSVMNERKKLEPESDLFDTPKKNIQKITKFRSYSSVLLFIVKIRKQMRFLSKLQALDFTSTKLVKYEVYSQMPLIDL